MQYLLTEEEYKELTNINKRRTEITKDQLQDLCTRIAKYEPITVPWRRNDAQPEPWGCILDEEESPGYCDECPVRELCPYPYKELSK